MGNKTPEHRGIRNRPKSDGTPVYYLNTTVDGYRLTEKAGHSLKAARALLAKRTAEIYEGKHFPRRSHVGYLVRQVCAEYAEKKLLHTKSGANRLHHFKPIDRLLGYIPIVKLRVSDVEEYQRIRIQERRIIRRKRGGVWVEEAGERITPNTVNHETNELMMALDWAVMERVIDYNPIKSLRRLAIGEPRKVMLDDGVEDGPQWQKLRDATPPWLRDIIECQYLTGMRIGEVVALTWDMVNLDTGIITLPGSVTKNGRSRKIPMYPRLIELLKSRPQVRPAIFAGKRGEPVQANAVIKSFARVTMRISMPHITTHALRRTRGQIWDSADRRMSAEALGHDERTHDRHYTEIKERTLAKLLRPPPDEED